MPFAMPYYYGGGSHSSVPVCPPCTPNVTTWEKVLTDNGAATFSGRNVRSMLYASDISTNGCRCRVRVMAANASLTVEDMYIGPKATSGNAYDIQAGTITEVTFAGGSGFSLTSGEEIESDIIRFDLNASVDHIISWYITNGRVKFLDTVSTQTYQQDGPNEADQEVASAGYNTRTDHWTINRVQVCG